MAHFVHVKLILTLYFIAQDRMYSIHLLSDNKLHAISNFIDVKCVRESKYGTQK